MDFLLASGCFFFFFFLMEKAGSKVEVPWGQAVVGRLWQLDAKNLTALQEGVGTDTYS